MVLPREEARVEEPKEEARVQGLREEERKEARRVSSNFLGNWKVATAEMPKVTPFVTTTIWKAVLCQYRTGFVLRARMFAVSQDATKPMRSLNTLPD